MENVLSDVTDRTAFRAWLARHGGTEAECWVAVKRGRPVDQGVFYYLDAVEEVLGMPEGLRAFALLCVGYAASERPQEDRYDATRIHVLDNPVGGRK